MKSSYALLLLFALALLLTGCHSVLEIEMVNNTGQDLAIDSFDTQMKRTSYSLRAGETARINVWYKLQILHGGETWDYHGPPVPPPLPKNFRKRIGVNRFLEKYQIGKDGAIYVLLPDSQRPTSDLPPQPSGYPVRPK